jgi:hypothetical protein
MATDVRLASQGEAALGGNLAGYRKFSTVSKGYAQAEGSRMGNDATGTAAAMAAGQTGRDTRRHDRGRSGPWLQ